MLRTLLQLLSWISLVATILPSLLYLSGGIDLDRCKMSMLTATIVWFAVTPWWMERGQAESAEGC